MGDSYLLSLLTRQLALLGDRFATRYPHPAWLVWESTAGVRPTNGEQADAGRTQVPSGVTHLKPAGHDAVCFPVMERQVTVGRARSNQIAIEDMSMSRDHFLLFLEGNTWYLALAEPVTCATFVRRMSVESKKPVFLVDGCHIAAGDVQLTFHERDSFLERLRVEEKRQAAG